MKINSSLYRSIQKYNIDKKLGIPEDQLKFIASSLTIAGYSPSDSNLVEAALKVYKHKKELINPLSGSRVVAYTDSGLICPLCNDIRNIIDISLIHNRKAKYCKIHKVSLPLPV